MDRLLYLLLVLACPVVMGVMMWLMMRGGGHRGTDRPTSQAPLSAAERVEFDQLREAGRQRWSDQPAVTGPAQGNPRRRPPT